jgi:hypothetical protein
MPTTHKPRTYTCRNYQAKLSDSEVITMEICGEYFKLQTTKTSSTTLCSIPATSFPSSLSAACLSARPPISGSPQCSCSAA